MPGLANLALAHFYLPDFAKALDEARRAVELSPKNLIARNNLALFAMYAGDLRRRLPKRKAAAAQGGTFSTYLPLAMEAVVKGDMAAAAAAYDGWRKPAAEPHRWPASGVRPGAVGGRVAAAETELKTGSPQTRPPEHECRRAEAGADRRGAARGGQRPQAADAAHDALKLSRQIGVLVPAARVLLRAGKAAEARTLAAELEGELQKQSRAYGKSCSRKSPWREEHGGDRSADAGARAVRFVAGTFRSRPRLHPARRLCRSAAGARGVPEAPR